MLGISEGLKNKHRDAYNCILLLAALEKKKKKEGVNSRPEKLQRLRHLQNSHIYGLWFICLLH